MTAAADLAALRHGVRGQDHRRTADATYVIAWRTAAGKEFELNGRKLLAPPNTPARTTRASSTRSTISLCPPDRPAGGRNPPGRECADRGNAISRQGLCSRPCAVRRPGRARFLRVLSKPGSRGGSWRWSSRLNPWLSDAYVIVDTWNGGHLPPAR